MKTYSIMIPTKNGSQNPAIALQPLQALALDFGTFILYVMKIDAFRHLLYLSANGFSYSTTCLRAHQ